MEVLALIVENNQDLKNLLRLKGMMSLFFFIQPKLKNQVLNSDFFLRKTEGIKVILSILNSKNEDVQKSSGRLLLKTCEDNHFNQLEIIMNDGTGILTRILTSSSSKELDSVVLGKILKVQQ